MSIETGTMPSHYCQLLTWNPNTETSHQNRYLPEFFQGWANGGIQSENSQHAIFTSASPGMSLPNMEILKKVPVEIDMYISKLEDT